MASAGRLRQRAVVRLAETSGASRPASLFESMVMKVDGACHCGLISFTAEIEPSRVMVCHCSDCQVLSGAPFRANAVAPREDVMHFDIAPATPVA